MDINTSGGRGRIRTAYLMLAEHALYHAELRARRPRLADGRTGVDVYRQLNYC